MPDKERIGVVPSRSRELTSEEQQVFGVRRARAPVTDFWLEVELDDSWRAAFRLVPYGGQPVVAEVRVMPADDWPGRPGGEWRAAVLGIDVKRLDGSAPRAGVRFPAIRQGIAAQLLRQVPFAAVQRHAREFAEKTTGAAQIDDRGRVTVGLSADGLAALALHTAGFRSAPAAGVRRPATGRAAGWPDERYVELAAAYAAAVEQGSRRPIADVAKRRRLSTSQVRDAIHTARARGLLTTTTRQGRAGGHLTPKAESILAARSKGRRNRQ